jgi:hypothetical protein
MKPLGPGTYWLKMERTIPIWDGDRAAPGWQASAKAEAPAPPQDNPAAWRGGVEGLVGIGLRGLI